MLYEQKFENDAVFCSIFPTPAENNEAPGEVVDLHMGKLEDKIEGFSVDIKNKVHACVQEALKKLQGQVFENYARTFFAYRELPKVFFPCNRALLAEAFRKVGLTQMAVKYEGEGDTGGVVSFDAMQTNGDKVDLLHTSFAPILEEAVLVIFARTRGTTIKLHAELQPLRKAMTMFYDDVMLVSGHAGYENNSGGEGEISFIVTPEVSDTQALSVAEFTTQYPDGEIRVRHGAYYKAIDYSETTL